MRSGGTIERPSHRVALLGAGHIHVTDHLDALRDRTDARVVAVWDADARRAAWAAARADAPVVADPARAVDLAPTLALVCAETVDHRRLLDLAVRARVAVFVEKPLGLDATESRQIAERVSASGLRFGTGFFLRHVPALRRMRELVTNGVLGRLSAVHASFTHNGGPLGWFSGRQEWMADPARAGYGGFGDLGLHLVDLVPFLLSASPSGDGPLAVRAAVLGSAMDRPVDDHGTALLAAGGGLPVNMTAGWVSAPGGLEVTITGTAGTATARDGTLTHFPRGEPAIRLVDDEPPAAARALTAFLDGDDEPDAASRAVAAAQIIDAAYARQGTADPRLP
jgi:predicted dehydrogenase